MAMTEFDMKVLDNFPGKVVRKDLTSLMKKGANVPTYVLEYLLGSRDIKRILNRIGECSNN